MNKYKITNKVTGEVKEAEADYLGTAIMVLGWELNDCLCEIITAPKKRGRPLKKPAESEGTDSGVEQPDRGAIEQAPPVAPEVVERARKAQQADQADAAASDKFQKKLERTIKKIDSHSLIGDPTEAEKMAYGHKQEIEQLAIGAEVMFLAMGQLLYGARIAGEWSILHYESYREYIEDLKLPVQSSYSWATRLASIYEYLVKNMKIDEKILAEIGVAKLTRLLPLARSGELTDEVIEAARILSDLDLRAQLGHDVSGGEEKPNLIICGRCGEIIDVNKASRP